MKKYFLVGFSSVLFIFLIQTVTADLIIPSKTLIYIESFGEKVQVPLDISYYDIGYVSLPWEEKIKKPIDIRIDFWNFSYKKYGDFTYAHVGGKYVISKEKRVRGKLNDEVYFDQKIDENFRKCESIGQFQMSTYGKDGEKYYVFDDQDGFNACIEKVTKDTEWTKCEEIYRREVDPKEFERDPDGNILENICEVRLEIDEKSWNNPKKAKEIIGKGKLSDDIDEKEDNILFRIWNWIIDLLH